MNENKTPFEKKNYKSALGSLIYLSKCSPQDIEYTVNKEARNAKKSNNI